ncbi:MULTISPECIES: hypothetical protein [Paenibacillus]|uniref:hypothetical protein n=1 Tax=Paenibacillus TaxID=44249 RepID=UPI0022B91D9A|nr:hypothetical protein [Paenibacillus caseinilyticus]MCZ8520488.1 hypothetical protein [Paenibacillus caseinilyticus]
MFIRKLMAAYFTAWTLIFLFSFPFMGGMGGGRDLENYMGWVGLVAAYAVPGSFVYGVGLSALLEGAFRAWGRRGPGAWLLSGMLHVLTGFLFGFVVDSSLFSILGGTAAVIYFGYDRWIDWRAAHTPLRIRWLLAAVPVLLFGAVALLLYLL